jgi:hypothetical protein
MIGESIWKMAMKGWIEPFPFNKAPIPYITLARPNLFS